MQRGCGQEGELECSPSHKETLKRLNLLHPAASPIEFLGGDGGLIELFKHPVAFMLQGNALDRQENVLGKTANQVLCRSDRAERRPGTFGPALSRQRVRP
jgi:hypothetical protein